MRWVGVVLGQLVSHRLLSQGLILSSGRRWCLAHRRGSVSDLSAASWSRKERMCKGPTATSLIADVGVEKKNLETVEGLEPAGVWEAFARLSAVPRPSGEEERVRNFVKSVAVKEGLEWAEDEVGNVVIKAPGVGAGVDAAPVLIQGHLDMVTEKNAEVDHDFSAQGIELALEGGFCTSSKKTTLGADNGVGVAAALACLRSTKSRPPLELLFTIDEERGLIGAKSLDAETLGLKARVMLNLDTEEWPSVYVGCSGGGDSVFRFPATRSSTTTTGGAEVVEVRVSGCVGGHSGVDIHRGRANAVEIAAEIASELLEEDGFQLIGIEGGDKRNAIPREAVARFVVSGGNLKTTVDDRFAAKIAQLSTTFKTKYASTDPELSVIAVESKTNEQDPLDAATAAGLVSMLKKDLVRGVVAFSKDIPDLVETSSNLASVALAEDDDGSFFKIVCTTRSSVASELEAVRSKLKRAVLAAGGSVLDQPPAYDGWQPNLDSHVLKLTKDCYFSRAGVQPETKAIHAGLECGILIARISPSLDCVSFGPTIQDAHTPDERLTVDTVQPFYDLLLDLLERLAALPSP